MPTLRQQIAQMLIIGFNGVSIDDSTPLFRSITQEGLGGVLLFDYDLINKKPGKNLVNQSQIKQLNQQLQHAAQQGPQQLPLFIAIDYEGGAVDRLKSIPGVFPTVTPAQFAMLNPIEQEKQARQMALTLKHLGFNLNFAPVVDLNLVDDAGIIGKLGRSFSNLPAKVVQCAKHFIKAFAEQDIVCCFKHFPGHGSAKGDTHEGFVDVTETFALEELEPYRLLSRHSIHTMVMTAHVINRKLDPSGLPATLSAAILQNLLRQQIGFNGIIISDDLQMHAISRHFSIEEALQLTINAGADMIIFANQLGSITPDEVVDNIEKLVLDNKVKAERIESAYQRILSLKEKIFNACCA